VKTNFDAVNRNVNAVEKKVDAVENRIDHKLDLLMQFMKTKFEEAEEKNDIRIGRL
jgi:hypothetical protein